MKTGHETCAWNPKPLTIALSSRYARYWQRCWHLNRVASRAGAVLVYTSLGLSLLCSKITIVMCRRSIERLGWVPQATGSLSVPPRRYCEASSESDDWGWGGTVEQVFCPPVCLAPLCMRRLSHLVERAPFISPCSVHTTIKSGGFLSGFFLQLSTSFSV